MAVPTRRPPTLRRSWMFCAGADPRAHAAALAARPDVLIPDLEDFTPPERRAEARVLIAGLLEACRMRGIVAGVRVNPLETVGLEDLAAVMHGRPDVVLLPKCASPVQVAALDQAVARQEEKLGIPVGNTELVPNIETARGLLRTFDIAQASVRVVACLLASEDMAADLGAERAPDGVELQYVRQRFLVDCTAAGVLAIDAPYTFSDAAGARAEAMAARRLGFKAKSLVAPSHTVSINEGLTPSMEKVAKAIAIVAAFERARASGLDRVELDGILVEVPTVANARRLIDRYQALAAFNL